MPIQLSICVPTHHGRAEPLRRAIASAVDQLDTVPPGSVEIVVSDNGSRDATATLVREVQQAHPGLLTYVRFEENRGFTANFLQAVGAARGGFCWLFSSDDALAPGALRRVLDLLAAHPDIAGMTIRPLAYDFSRGVPAPPFYPEFLPPAPEQLMRWATTTEAIEGCGAVMGLLPAQVLRRSSLDAAIRDFGTATRERYAMFPHYYLTLRVLLRDPAWLWDPGPTLLLRSEVGNSVIADMGGDLTGYHLKTTAEVVALWRELLGHDPVVRGLLAKTQRVIFPARAIALYKAQPSQTLGDDLRLLVRCTAWFWRGPSFWASLPVLLLPHPVARMLLRGVAAVRGLRSRRTPSS